MKYDAVLVRYGETFLKSERVRRIYVSKLARNIKAATGIGAKKERGLLILEWKGGMEEVLKKIPGIESFSPSLALESLEDERIDMFAKGKVRVEAKRADKSFPLNSREIARKVAMSMGKRGIETVLTGQDTTITLHITRSGIFAYSASISGMGGFPLGTTGKAVALVSGGIDSAVSAWLMIKKGVVIYPLFAMFPGESASRFIGICRKLGEYFHGERMRAFSFSMPFEACGKEAMIIYRRFMVRMAERLCDRIGCDFIVMGDSLAQVSSQTAKNIGLVKSRYPIIRPLIAMDKREIIDIARRIGTYEISISESGGCEMAAKKVRASGAVKEENVKKAEEMLGVGKLAEQTEITEVTGLLDRLF